MTQCVNICHGWSCVLVTRCGKSDFNYQPQPGTWSRHYQAPRTGDACVDYEPVHSDHRRRWGDGAEPND
jgi:hypothetical protein